MTLHLIQLWSYRVDMFCDRQTDGRTEGWTDAQGKNKMSPIPGEGEKDITTTLGRIPFNCIKGESPFNCIRENPL